MARSEQFTLKIRLSRSERRLLSRGYKAAGAPTLSGWVRDLSLKAAQPSQATPAAAPANSLLGPIPPHPVINGPFKPIGRGLKPGEHRPSWAPTPEADGPVRQDD